MGLSVTQLLIILAIVLLLFGAKRLRTIGTDLGSAVKGFKNAVKEDDAAKAEIDNEQASGAEADVNVAKNEQQNKV